MEYVLKFLEKKAFVRPKIRQDEKTNNLMKQLEDIKLRLKIVKDYFDLSTDEDLIESCIYEMESLETKYNYLIKKAKYEQITSLKIS